MYSPRVAYQEGRRIGRSLENLRVSDSELRTLVIAQLMPTIKLRESRKDHASASATAVSSVVIALAVVAVAFWVVQVLWPDARPVAVLPDAAKMVSSLVAVALGILSVGLAVYAHVARRRAGVARSAAYRLILNEGVRGAQEVVSSRRERAGFSVHRSPATSPRGIPAPVFDGRLSPRDAEELAAQWMRSLGALDAQATSYIGDGGIDVASSKFIAQVKHHAMPVGPGAVRELAGVASVDLQRRRALFFSTAGYQRGAIEFADRTLVALFHMVTDTGDLRAQNDVARQLLQHGLA